MTADSFHSNADFNQVFNVAHPRFLENKQWLINSDAAVALWYASGVLSLGLNLASLLLSNNSSDRTAE